MLRPSMFGMGFGELLMIALIALLFLGPDKLPDAAKHISKGIRDLRRSTKDLQQTIEQDTQLGTAMREIKSALRGDDLRSPPPKPPGATGTGTGAAKPGAAGAAGSPGAPGAPGAPAPSTPTMSAKKPAEIPTPADPAVAATPSRDPEPAPATATATEPAPAAPAPRPARASDGDDVSELAARLIRPAASSVPQGAKSSSTDTANDADGPGTPAAGSGSAHG